MENLMAFQSDYQGELSLSCEKIISEYLHHHIAHLLSVCLNTTGTFTFSPSKRAIFLVTVN